MRQLLYVSSFFKNCEGRSFSPSGAKLLSDALTRDGLADHWAEMLRPEVGQVNESVEVGGIPKGQLAKIAIALIMRQGVKWPVLDS